MTMPTVVNTDADQVILATYGRHRPGNRQRSPISVEVSKATIPGIRSARFSKEVKPHAMNACDACMCRCEVEASRWTGIVSRD